MREKTQNKVTSFKCLSLQNSIVNFYLNIARLIMDSVQFKEETHGCFQQVVSRPCYLNLNTTIKTWLHTQKLCIKHIRAKIVIKSD